MKYALLIIHCLEFLEGVITRNIILLNTSLLLKTVYKVAILIRQKLY